MKEGTCVNHVAGIGTDIAFLVRQYQGFAHQYAAGSSPNYVEIAERLAQDEQVLGLLSSLPAGNRRQPSLLLGAVRFLGGPVDSWERFRPWLVEHWERVREVVMRRRTQTNEVRRCASLLPLLAQLPGPLALIEVGASAGLCLYPDRYRYSFDGADPIGPKDSPVLLECATSGPVPVPERVPQVVWRAGVDLNPLDVTDAEDVRWLESLIWPGGNEAARRERLRAAARLVAADPPHLVSGDLVRVLPGLVAQAPKEATLVVFHSAVPAYLDPVSRGEFVRVVRGLPGHWVSNEGWRVFADQENARPETPTHFTLGLDGRVVGHAGEHGQSVTWLAGNALGSPVG